MPFMFPKFAKSCKHRGHPGNIKSWKQKGLDSPFFALMAFVSFDLGPVNIFGAVDAFRRQLSDGLFGGEVADASVERNVAAAIRTSGVFVLETRVGE